MSGPAALLTGQELERRGAFLQAAQAYLAAGAVEPAASALARLGRYFDAAHLLLSLARAEHTPRAEVARLLHHAAECLSRGGDQKGAAEIARQLSTLQAAHEPTTLVHTMPSGRAPPAPVSTRGPASASEAASAEAYKLGAQKIVAGNLQEGLEHLLAIPGSSAHYRNACVYAIHASCKLLHVSFGLDQFVGPFVTSGPRDDNELKALTSLGALYCHVGFQDEARTTLERVLQVVPGHAEAARLLRSLPAADVGIMPEHVDESAAFWSTPRRKRVSELPSAPQAPSVSQPPPASGSSPRVQGVAFRPGTLIANRYVIEQELGRGGMGIAYAALDRDLGERIAIKSFLRQVDDQALIARFKQELSISRQLSHQNIIRLHDMGVNDGRLFLTMELLVGGTLRAQLGDMTWAQKLDMLRQLTRGVSAIHARGVVHRDLKPSNVFFTTEGVVKVMDFGLAKRLDVPEADGLTASGFVAGTPGYMPPEQIMTFGEVGTTADVYALGVMTYEALGGHRPFRHKDASQIFRLQFTTTPEPLSAVAPDVTPELDAVVLAMLDREPENRPSLAELDAALARALG